MGKTKRNASRWMESHFKFGDTQYPENNETHYFNGRYQAKMRNGNRSYYVLYIDPESIKVRCWRDYDNWAKPIAHRAARHKAKIMTTKLAHAIMQEVWDDYWADMWSMDEDDWYENHSFDQDWEKDSYWEDYDFDYGYEKIHNDPWDFYY